MKNIHDDIERVLFTSEELVKRAEEIGRQITQDYKGEEVTVIGILKGSFMFLSDVLKNVDLYTKLDFVTVQSYGNGTTSGELRLTKDISADIKGKHVILVEDILDSGKTLKFVKDLFLEREPASIKVCTLLNKKVRKSEVIKADYIGFDVDNVFVVGYGLDYAQLYRNLPYIGELKVEARCEQRRGCKNITVEAVGCYADTTDRKGN